jgi:hypothetical protein
MKIHVAIRICFLTVCAFAFQATFLQAQEEHTATDQALGKLLFANVARVYFAGPGHPANSDGSLGGLVADEKGELKVYERFICREFTDQAGGTIVREFHSYDRLGKIEQRPFAFAASKTDSTQSAQKAMPIEARPARSPESNRVRRERWVDSLAEQFQKAKERNANVAFLAAQQRYSGKVISVSAERGIVQLNDQDGLELWVVLAKVEALSLPKEEKR